MLEFITKETGIVFLKTPIIEPKEEITSFLKSHAMNGSYVTDVCIQCGRYHCDQNGNTDEAIFYKNCGEHLNDDKL